MPSQSGIMFQHPFGPKLRAFLCFFSPGQAGLIHLGVAKVHLGMLLLEFLENIGLLLFIAGWQAGLLLALVKHHLLDHAACLAVQIRQFRRLWCDFGYINLGCIGDNVCPPLHLVDFVKVDLEGLGAVGCGLECPGAVVDEYGVGKVALSQ